MFAPSCERPLNAFIGLTAAFVSLTDGVTQYLLAGSRTHERQLGDSIKDTNGKWFGDSDVALNKWALLFRDTEKLSPRNPYSVISDLTKDSRFKTLPSVAGPPFLKFFAAVPISTKLRIRVGSMIILDTAARGEMLVPQTTFLQRMAEACMTQLEMAREATVRKRTMDLNQGLNSFIESLPMTLQALDEPRPFKQDRVAEQPQTDSTFGRTSSQVSKLSDEEKEAEKPASGVFEQVNPALGPAAHEAVASRLEGNSKTELQKLPPNTDRDETAYRRIFRRAAEHLQTSLEVDGVAFVDGLVGFHGELLPTAEPEQELEHEMAQRPDRKLLPGQDIRDDEGKVPDPKADAEPEAGFPDSTSSHEDNAPAHRTFTSADYQKSVLKKRPAEVLGLAVSKKERLPRLEALSETTKGLAYLDEGFLQEFMELHARGKVWYFDGNGGTFYFKDDVLVEDSPNSGVCQLADAFPGVKQIVFAPLTDYTTLKRLAGCFAWTTKPFPVFSDVADLAPYKAFIHSVEAEISRLDSMSALKQKESFVSSVSHELRTPLHGVLGALEFLEDTNLDAFQRSLAHTIRFCGSTLHQTLSSVLSYARISEFERRANKPLQKGPRESPWALLNKDEHTGADKDFHGPFVCTNLATLCEEIVEVTESGRSYPGSVDLNNLVLTLNIAYRENWDFVTEPGALRRILMNIIGNALKYSTNGYIDVSLDAKDLGENERGMDGSKSRRKLVTFTVKDPGKGMSRDFIQNHLFIPFVQEDAGKSEGVGLGMSIVKSLVAIIGGQINVKSRVGKGTEIRVAFPMEEGNPVPQKAPSTSSKMEHIILEVRERRLTVAVRGLDPPVDQSLRLYLTEWFKATVVREEDLARPASHTDILILDEACMKDGETTVGLVQTYGHNVALLSVSTSRKQSKNMTFVEESLPMWERIHPPLCPGKLSKALLKCIQKLGSVSATAGMSPLVGSSELGTVVEASVQHGEADDDPGSTPATADLPLLLRHYDAGTAVLPAPSAAESPEMLPFPATRKFFTPVSSAEPSSKRRKPRVLLVEDNIINLKLLQTFMTKYGAHETETAEDGIAAINAVKQHAEAFDVIFMGKYDTSHLLANPQGTRAKN